MKLPSVLPSRTPFRANSADQQDAVPDEDPEDYPEGGLRAWSVVLGAWCAMIPSMGFLNTLAVLEAVISVDELPGLSKSTTGWIFSCYGFFLYFCGAQLGPIFDAHDIKFLVIPGSVGMIISIMCLSVSREFWHYLLSFGVLGGISASLLFTPSISAIGHWFEKRRGLATGAACTAGGLGGVAYTLIILYLAPQIGFAWCIRIIGFISVLLSTLACFLLRKRLPPNKRAGASIDLKALSDVKYGATTFAVFLVEFAVFIPYTYISLYAIHAGIETQTAYRLNALLNAGAIPGRVLPGYLADRFGTFNVMCITAFTCATLVLALWLTAEGHEAAVTAFAILYGFWSGTAISMVPVCVGQVCRAEDYGKRNGTTYFVVSFGVLIGIPVAGAVLGASDGSYQGLIIFAGAMYAASVLAFIVARGLAGGWDIRVKF
ncbi:MFS general substrate transporter [Thozetella sp. PMI_491]|nr:MFS general substrate transporter [Thozetella sp. PMI_491]